MYNRLGNLKMFFLCFVWEAGFRKMFHSEAGKSETEFGSFLVFLFYWLTDSLNIFGGYKTFYIVAFTKVKLKKLLLTNINNKR